MSESNFDKVELLVKSENAKNQSINKLSYSDCGVIISGDFLIISTKEIENAITNRIFPLRTIDSYRTYTK